MWRLSLMVVVELMCEGFNFSVEDVCSAMNTGKILAFKTLKLKACVPE